MNDSSNELQERERERERRLHRRCPKGPSVRVTADGRVKNIWMASPLNRLDGTGNGFFLLLSLSNMASPSKWQLRTATPVFFVAAIRLCFFFPPTFLPWMKSNISSAVSFLTFFFCSGGATQTSPSRANRRGVKWPYKAPLFLFSLIFGQKMIPCTAQSNQTKN